MYVFKKTKPKTNFNELHKIIFGIPKVGKTTLASLMTDGKKEPFFIFTEDGHGVLELLHERVKNYDELVKALTSIVTNEKQIKEKCSCIVLDLVSDIDRFVEDKVKDEFKVKDLGDVGFAKAYNRKKEILKNIYFKLMDILPCVFITHIREKVLNIKGKEESVYTIELSNQSKNIIEPKADLTMFYFVDEKGQRAISCTPDELAYAGSRYKQLEGKRFLMDGNNLKDSYEKIVKTFKGGK